MSILDKRLEEIEKKVIRLIEQNVQYKHICEDLLSVRRRLEKDIKTKSEMLERIGKELEVVDKNAQLIDEELDQEEEVKKEQIQKYIQDIKNSIGRLH